MNTNNKAKIFILIIFANFFYLSIYAMFRGKVSHYIQDYYTSINKKLLEAAKKGNVSDMEHLLELGASIEIRDKEKNWTPLQYAVNASCSNGGINDAVKFLLQNGASANVDHDDFPLRIACNYRNTEMVELLVHYGADVDRFINNKYKYTQLYYAAQNGQEDLVIVLLAYGASVENSVILPGCVRPMAGFFCLGNYRTYVKTIKALTYAGIDPQKKDEFCRIPWKLTDDKYVQQILTNPIKIKNYCTEEEKEEFEEMMKSRRIILIKKHCTDNKGNVLNQLKLRELNGRFPSKFLN